MSTTNQAARPGPKALCKKKENCNFLNCRYLHPLSLPSEHKINIKVILSNQDLNKELTYEMVNLELTINQIYADIQKILDSTSKGAPLRSLRPYQLEDLQSPRPTEPTGVSNKFESLSVNICWADEELHEEMDFSTQPQL